MKNLGLSLAVVAAAVVSAAAAPVRSICTFQAPQGQGQAIFSIEDRLVRTTLSINGADVPALEPTCFAHRRGGLHCPHGDGRQRYEIYPFVDDDDRVTGANVLMQVGDDWQPVEPVDCSPL